jgi:hypothetical protein
VSKTFGEWYQKTNKTEDRNKLTLLAFKIIAILHNTRLATFIKLLETVRKGSLGIDRRTAVTRSWIAAADGIAKWQTQWDRTSKGALCRTFLLSVEQRLKASLPISPAFTAMVSGHGKTKSYLHRFGFIDSQKCPCKGGDQTPKHIVHHCNVLKTQRDVLIRNIERSGGTWPTCNKDLIAKHLKAFTNFINSMILINCHSNIHLLCIQGCRKIWTGFETAIT